MLKIVSSKPCAYSRVNFDPYVPLEIELEGATEGEARLYWRAQEGAASLVEIGIRPSDGRVQSVTVTSVAPGCVWEAMSELNHVEQVEAAPCADLTAWPLLSNDFASRFVDENCPISLAIGNDSVEVWFCPERVVGRWFSVGDARFGVSGHALVCVQVRGLSPAQVADLRGSALG